MRRFLLTTSIATILVLTACEGDHWGAEKKEKLKGERLPIIMPYSQEALNITNNLPADTTQVRSNADWLASIANSTAVGGNLKLDKTPNKKISLKIQGNPLFGLISTPIVHGGNIYTIDAHGNIAAFVLPTGKKLWQSKALQKEKANNSFLTGGITLANGVIYGTAGLDKVVALDATTGQNKWLATLRSPSRAVPVLANGLLIVQSLDNITYALDATNGNIVWAHIGVSGEAQALAPTMPVVDGDAVIVQYSSGEIHKLSLHDGEEVWQVNILPQATISLAEQNINRTPLTPLLQNNKVYAVSPIGNLLCFSAADGTLLWHKDLHIDGGLWLTDNYIYAITDAKKLIAIHKQDGAIKWQTDITAHLEEKNKKQKAKPVILATPIVADGQVLVNASSGQQLRFNMQNGQLQDKVQIATQVTLPPVVANGKMYILSNSGRLQ